MKSRALKYLPGISLLFSIWLVPQTGLASRLDEVVEALDTGDQVLDVSVVPMYQRALDAQVNTGNYTFDVIGKFNLAQRSTGKLGSTDLIFWVNSSDKLSSLSASAFSEEAGLLWDTNDIGADTSATSFLVLAIDQWFLDNTLSVGFGKYFPGQAYLVSPYTADNSNSFTNKMIASNPVVSWWEAIGLGVNVGYFGEDWFLQGGFVDTEAEGDLDFNSFTDGKYAYLLEATYAPRRDNGATSIGVVGYYIDSKQDTESESGAVFQFTHEFGDDQAYALFARYSYRNGGEGKGTNNTGVEPVVKQGGFVGAAWNNPFGADEHQIGASLIFSQAADYKTLEGFNDQFGGEIYWKFQPNAYLKVIPNIQVMQNIDDRMETIIGIRIGLGFVRDWNTTPLI